MLSGLGMTMRKASLAGSFAWKHNDAEDADAAEGAASGDMPTVSPGDWATAKLLAKKRGRGGV